MGNVMTTLQVTSRFKVDGMDCGACASKIEAAVSALPGTSAITASATTGSLSVTHDPVKVAPAAICDTVNRLGYRATPAAATKPAAETDGHTDAHSSEDEDGDTPWLQSPKFRLTVAAAAALVVAWLVARIFPATAPWGFIFATVVGLAPIAWRAVAAARAGMPFTIETLMTVAAAGAIAIGAAEEAAVVVVLFLFGELLEGVAAGRARRSIRALTAFLPKTALVERGGATVEVRAETVAVGDILFVRPGDRIPADGDIIDGESGIDESPVTGESVPKRKLKGDAVFAGTVNQDAVLRIKATASAADNTISRVVRLVEQAQEAKAPTQRFIDRFSRYYTPAVLIAGAAVALLPPLLAGADWGTWIYRGLALLLIGCPCALVISTPAAIAAGLSAGARQGLLIKGGAVLERLGRVNTVAFDKTGTLTEGKPKVTDVVAIKDESVDVLRLAAALETGSSHPLAKAILSHATENGMELPKATGLSAIGGKGVIGRIDGVDIFLGSPSAAAERGADLSAAQARISDLNGEGKTVSVLLAANDVAGLIAMRDEPRIDARIGLSDLRSRGIESIMLTGDNRQTAEAVGRALGIEVKAELLPQDKLAVVEDLRGKGRIVAKVGDGINDAPALAAADVGIAMGGGTDVALETGDAASLHGRVKDVAAMIDLSRRTMTNIRQNIAASLGLKAVFLVTTLLGITGLWPAILADTGATVLVTINALRLLRSKDMQNV